jgi:hypothetical protein
MNFTEKEIAALTKRKQMKMLWLYPQIQWLYVRFYSWYGFYWAYKLFKHDLDIPGWEQWALWFFAMASLYFFAREERLDGFFDKKMK